MAMEDELCTDTPPAEWLEGYHAGRQAAARDLESYLLGASSREWRWQEISLVASGDKVK